MDTKILFIIGPGGVGKTTSGKLLAKIIGYNFIDLDEEFCKKIENISQYLKKHSYREYAQTNSTLFFKILHCLKQHSVFVLSSGFLVHEGMNDLISEHKKVLKDNGISILLLPTKDVLLGAEVIVRRQLKRGYGLNKKREMKKYIKRFGEYSGLGDIQIFSYSSPEIIAKKIFFKLNQRKLSVYNLLF